MQPAPPSGFPAPRAAGFRCNSTPLTSVSQTLDKNFWILRELGRHVVLVEHGADLPDFGRCPEEIPI